MPTRKAKARTGTVSNRDANRAIKNANRPAAILPQISELRIRPGRRHRVSTRLTAGFGDPAPKSKTHHRLLAADSGDDRRCQQAAPRSVTYDSAEKLPELQKIKPKVRILYTVNRIMNTEDQVYSIGESVSAGIWLPRLPQIYPVL